MATTFIDIGTIIVRSLINDLSDTPVYDDDRIAQTLVVAGLIVAQEFPLNTTYTFDVETPSISPDPTDPNLYNGAGDQLFIALDTLKAACLLNLNTMETAVGNSIEIRDGDSMVNTTKSVNGYQYLLQNGICATYDAMKKRQMYISSGQNLRCVLNSFAHVDFLLSGSYALSSYYSNFRVRS